MKHPTVLALYFLFLFILNTLFMQSVVKGGLKARLGKYLIPYCTLESNYFLF